ncbi:MAG: hypothetical protein ACREB7_06610 [Sphingopyxis sp.]|uniref:hypothetical protein n=1 Tax=Sphingopyxis sp. TaxID=1908224 RepID=UPI003D6D8D3E
MLEHGFDDGALANLLTNVRGALDRHTIDGGWWNTRPLPLLVGATDIGYSYAGTGTDFWPMFSGRFAVTRAFDRAVLSRLFEQAAIRYNLSRPPETAWNLAFCHIAWPVLHAILPAELLQPLTRCLKEVRARLDLSASDVDLLAPIRSRARLFSSLRLSAWLENETTAAAIIRAFLDPSAPPLIEATAMARIQRDLSRDASASASLRDARRRQRALAEMGEKRAPRRRAAAEIRIAPLILRRTDQSWSLALKLPQMEETERVTARETLDSMRWRASLWGEGRAIPSRNLFSDYPIALYIEELPSSDAPIFPDLANLQLAAEARQFLESLRIASGPRLIFSDADAAGDYCQIQTDTLSANNVYLVLAAPEHLPAPPSVVSEGRIVGYQILRVDAGADDVAPWLAGMGLSLSAPARLRWIGAPELEQHRPRRRFASGTQIGFEIVAGTGACRAKLSVPGGETLAIEGASPLIGMIVPAIPGVYTLTYGESERVEFDVVERADTAPLVTIDADAGTGAITDLATRGITLRFDSIASLQEAEIELIVRVGGQNIGRAVDVLPDTPCRLSASHLIWDRLLTADVVERLLEASSADLIVNVTRIAETRFSFEALQAPFSWQRTAEGLVAEDETGLLPLFSVEAAYPFSISEGGPNLGTNDVVLVRAGRDGPMASGGYCLGPKSWNANEAPLPRRPERLLRRFDGLGESLDARTSIDSLVAWSAASVDHPITQYRRGQTIRLLERWAVAQLCGEAWSKTEASLTGKQGQRFASDFLDACGELGIGFVDLDLTGEQRGLLRRTLLRLIRVRSLDLTPTRALQPIDEDFAASLDELFNDAYAGMAEAIEAVGDEAPFNLDDDIDVGEASDDWDRALRRAADQSALGDLVELLRPLEAGENLSLADFATMTPDESIDLLTAWIENHRPDHHSRAWSRELVEASFWLFAKPGVAARLPWRSATQRLLADSFSARAIRYAVLRSGAGGAGGL